MVGNSEDPSEFGTRTLIVRQLTLDSHHLPLTLNSLLPPIRVATALITQGPASQSKNLRFAVMLYDANGSLVATLWADSLENALDRATTTVGIEPDEWETVSRLLVDVPIISVDLLRQLTRVPPSTETWITFRPCRVRLRDGSWYDRIYVQDVETVDQGGTGPSSGNRLDFSKIVEIEESPQRLPPVIADALYAAGESAMGGCYFALITRSGRRILCQTGNFVDFVALPSDVLPNDIVDVEPHADDARTAEHPVGPLEHSWSLYALPQ